MPGWKILRAYKHLIKKHIMKYPRDQYKTLVSALSSLSLYDDIRQYDPVFLHFEIYQNLSIRHMHNWLYYRSVPLGQEKYRTVFARGWQIKDPKSTHRIKNWELGDPTFFKIIPFEDEDFKLYPEGCNDNHVETAVKRAVKEALASEYRVNKYINLKT